MAHLAKAIVATETPITMASAVTVGSYPGEYTLDDEAVLVIGGSGGTSLSVIRGARGTAAASHVAGTELVPWDPTPSGGGGGVSVEVPPAAPVAVTNIIAPGASISGGTATLAGFALVGLAGLADVQLVDGDNGAHALELESIYDPAGYFDALVPDQNVPGFVVPAGQGGIHRATLFVECIDQVSSPPPVWRIYAAIGFNSLANTSDTRVLTDTTLPGQRFSLIASFCGQLDDGEYLYYYVQCDDGEVAKLNLYPVTYASIERLTS